MHKHTLRELSKFASGLIAGDLLFGFWLYVSGLLPQSFFGINITAQGAIAGMAFDIIILAFLVHFGWRTKSQPRTKREHNFHIVAAIIFALVALVHLSRLIFGWEFVIGTWDFPYWLNGLGAIVAAFLAYASFVLAD